MRVLLTGGSGMLGQSLLRLAPEIAPDLTLIAPSRADLPLTDRAAVARWFAENPVDAVIHAAARVGGIQANIADPVGFLSENLVMNEAVIMGAHQAGVGRLVFLGSSCMYPRDHRQPLVEEDVLAAPLEPTNEGYALSKITGARLCDYISRQVPDRAYRTLIPCNLFGTGDHFGSAASHLIAAIITKVVDARNEGAGEVEIWGTGRARREFLDVDHLSRFILTRLPDLEALPWLLNIGAGRDHSVDDYYRMVAGLAGWQGRFVHDETKPEGMMAKLMSSAKAEAIGYAPPGDITPDLARAIAAYESRKAG
ncbi:NAD-dependent epimerase/dehydratase family protein [Paracoccus zhejiangensis]|uniref:GDP-L-fucose synthase n=1 Tax=Paracoccus zhejiangensis TaxID=1077935 RepID=A0A2H5EW02_9RHOB|nr:NAD-dependent epimerase/dehydratase family protein [Paracoccus zhejiangensis]AUH63477.1 GDP-fucose synthetase [Paracoccus zhejiangensis]